VIDIGLLEYCIREDLNKKARRVMGVLNPLKIIIDNYPDDRVEEMEAVNNPEDLSAGTRNVPFSKVIYIEQEDFMESPSGKFFRLAPGREVRLRSAYIIKCESVNKDPYTGQIKEVHCSYDPATKSGMPDSNRKVKGTLHWVSEKHAINAEIRLYDRLFKVENPDNPEEGKTYKDYLNPDSLMIKTGFLEPLLKNVIPGEKFQFERIGYFCVDKDSSPDKLIFNCIVQLKDRWARIDKAK